MVNHRSAKVTIGRDAAGRLVFVIDVVEGSTLRIRLTGFWSEAVFSEFVDSYRTALEVLECVPGGHKVLCDASSWPVQQQEVADRFHDLVGSNPSAPSTLMAVVCGSTLLRMQVKRIAVRPTLRVFAELAEAERWLGAR